MNPLFSAPDWCFLESDIDPQEYYHRLKKGGFTAVEMLDEERIVLAEAAGLQVLNHGAPGMAEGPADPHFRDAVREGTLAAIDHAGRYDIPHVIVFSGNGDPTAGVGELAEFFRPLAVAAAQQQVVLTFEMFNLSDHPGYQACRSKFGFDLARAVDHPSFRILYDAYHMQRMGDDPVRDIAENVDLIAHIHLAEVPSRKAPLPEGALPTRRIIQTALSNGYQGLFGLEYFAGSPRVDDAVATLRSLAG